MHFLALFHTAIPIQPPPLRGTSFHRKEGVSTRAPSFGRGCRAQRGGVGFLFGQRSGALVNDALETIFFALFHTARTLSGSLRSPPSPHGEGFIRPYCFSTHACIRSDDMGIAVLSYRSLPHLGKLCWGKRYSRFFIHPTQKRPSLTSGRFYVYYLLKETPIKSQNSI